MKSHKLFAWSGLKPVRKNTTHKESSQEKSHIQEQGLITGSSRQAGRGKMAPGVTFIEGEVKEVSACMVVSVRGGAVLEHRNFC
jgi:hypothetical protein